MRWWRMRSSAWQQSPGTLTTWRGNKNMLFDCRWVRGHNYILKHNTALIYTSIIRRRKTFIYLNLFIFKKACFCLDTWHLISFASECWWLQQQFSHYRQFHVETGSLESAAPLLCVEHHVCCIPELPPTCVHVMTDMEHVINSFKHVWMWHFHV